MATIEKYQTRSGATLYRVRYRKPDRKQTQKRGFTTKRDAELFAATVEVAKARGEYVAPAVGRTTIGELGPAWLARQRGHLKAASIAGCESSWRTHVQPRWGAAQIGDIRHSDVQAWVAELSARRGPDCVRAAVRVLRGVLDDAVADRMIAVNAVRRGQTPQAVADPAHLPDSAPARPAGRRVRPLPIAGATARGRWASVRGVGCFNRGRRGLPAPTN